MNPSLLPLLIVVATLVSGIVIFLTPDRMVRFRTALNVAGALITLAFVVILVFGVLQGGNYATRMPLLPGAPLLLQSDALSLLFAGLSAVLWLVTTVYAVGYLRRGPHRPRFFGFFALCVSATMGVALAGNLLTFLVFYEMLTLSTYPLVTHRGDAASLRAGRIYLAYTLTGGALLLLGTMLLYALQGSGDFIVGGLLSGAEDRPSAGVLGLLFLILIAGVGVKAALVPLHGWLPVAMVAPAPVSALLHAVAVVKAGVFGIVRIVYDIFGEPLVEALNLLMPLAAVAGATILYGSIRALGQDDLKRRLAFSTVSQVSYIALGVSLAHPVAALGGIIHLVHQGIMKITLFFCAGAVSETTGIKKISQMDGLGRRMPWTMGAFTIAAVGMIGLPPTAGFVTKWYVSSGGLETGATWVMVLMLISSGLNAAYFLPVMQRVWFLAPPPQQAGHPGRSKASLLLVGPPLVTAALTVAAALFADSPFSPLGWTEALVLREFGFAGTSPDEARVPGNPLLLLSLAPLAVTVFAVLGLGRAVWPLFALAAVPAAVTAAFMPGDAAGGEIPALRLDPDFAPFLLAAALIWAAAAIHSRQSVGGAANARRYAIFFGLAMTGNIGLVIADNMVAFYVGFSVMSLAVYGLVAHKGTAETDRASRIYMWLAVAGELTLFAAILLISSAQDGTLPPRLTGAAPSGAAAWLVLIGCGIKAGLVPLHVWLSLAHPVAPVPASAALSGAMLKAGIIGMLLLVPPELGTPEGFGEIMILTGLAGAFGGAVYGTMQRDLKTALAYSSLSQMGLALTALGAAYAGLAQAGAAAAALALFAIHHGLAKGALFLGAQSGVPRGATIVLMAVPALALTGASLTSGYLSKEAFTYALEGGPLAKAFTIAGFGTALVMARSLWLASRTTPLPDNWRASAFAGLALASITLPAFWPGGPEKLMSGLAPPALSVALSPAVVALAATVLALRLRPMLPPAPPGDVLVLVEPVARMGIPLRLAISRRADHAAAYGGTVVAGLDRALKARLKSRPTEPPERWTAATAALVVALLAVALAVMS